MNTGLPYDAEIEYLESTGKQWINTGINGGNDDLSFEVSFRTLVFRSYAGVFGNYRVESTNCWRLLPSNTNSGTHYICANTRPSNSASAALPINNDYVFRLNKTKFSVNGVEYNSPTVKGSAWNGEIGLFLQRTDAADSYKAIMRLYYCKIWDGSVLIRDFIPVRIGQVGYMYDRVTRKLFGNQGTGSFVLGPDVSYPLMGLHLAATPPSAKSYVQDGLIAMWDGIENAGWGVHDSNATVWKDLIGERDLSFASTSSSYTSNDIKFEDACLYCRHSGFFAQYSEAFYDWITVEVVFAESRLIGDNSGFHAFVFNSGIQNRRLCGYRGLKWCSGSLSPKGGYIGTTGHGSWVPNHVAAIWDSNVQAAKILEAYLNGKLSNGSIDGHTLATTTPLRTGGYNGNYPAHRDYSIRLYSRALTAEEIAYNYAVDKRRFNLP